MAILASATLNLRLPSESQEQLAQGRYLTAARPRVELATSRVASQRPLPLLPLSGFLFHFLSSRPLPYDYSIVTFCVSRRRRKMYCGHARLSVCLSAAVRPHYCTDPDVTWGHVRGCPLVVHYWADLQSGHGLRCYGNITRTLVTSLRPSRDMTT